MKTRGHVWISAQAYERLQRELATLRGLIDSAAAEGDDTDSAAVVRRARQLRIQRIHELLIDAVVGEDPPADGIAEPGMVVTVRYHDTGDTETFLLGVRGAEYADMDVYSVQSPLGSAVLGAGCGQQRSFTSPGGDVITVTVLDAVPYGIHNADLTTQSAQR